MPVSGSLRKSLSMMKLMQTFLKAPEISLLCLTNMNLCERSNKSLRMLEQTRTFSKSQQPNLFFFFSSFFPFSFHHTQNQTNTKINTKQGNLQETDTLL